MQPPRVTAAERAREEREQAMRRRRTSVRIGTAGVIVLFAAGIGVVLSPSDAATLVAVMLLGIVLIGAAFLLVRPRVSDPLEKPGP